MRKPLRIGVDFDGVISDCSALKSKTAFDLYGLTVPPEKFKKELLLSERIMTEEQYRTIQKTIYSTREVGLLMEPVPGAHRHLCDFQKFGDQVTVVTSRANLELEIAKEWSVLNSVELDFVGVGYGNSKAGALEGFDVFIDDDYDKLEPLKGVVPHRFLFSWGYNAHIQVGSGVRRIAGWDEFAEAVARLRA